MGAKLLKLPFNTQNPPVPATSLELTADEREFLPDCLEILETPPSPYQRAVVWCIAAVIVVALMWSAVGTLEVVSTATGRFIPDGRVKVVQVTETAIVRALHVKEGQHVNEGDLLMELDPTLAEADLHGSLGALKQSDGDAARIKAQLTGQAPQYGALPKDMVLLQETLRSATEAAYQVKLSATSSALLEKQAALGAAEATLKKHTELLAIAREQEQQNLALEKEQFISRADYLEKHQSLVTAENDYQAQIRTVEQGRQAVNQAKQELDLVTRDHKAELLKDLNSNATAHPDLQAKFERAAEIHALKTLRAPVSGYVQTVSVTTIGGVVSPAQSLVTIVPDGTPLIFEAALSNADIGYVKVGQPVEIKLDTYPYQTYGSLKGELVWISPDSENRSPTNPDQNSAQESANSSSNSATESKAPIYRVHVRVISGEKLLIHNVAAEIKPGMSAQVDIKTDSRRIYEFFLSPIAKYISEGLSVR